MKSFIFFLHIYIHSIGKSAVFSTWIVVPIIKANTKRIPMFVWMCFPFLFMIRCWYLHLFAYFRLTPEEPLAKFMLTFHAYRCYDFHIFFLALQTLTTSYGIFYGQQILLCTFSGADWTTHHLFNSVDLSLQLPSPYIDCSIPSISEVLAIQFSKL